MIPVGNGSKWRAKAIRVFHQTVSIAVRWKAKVMDIGQEEATGKSAELQNLE
jgi:hypothetical protein